MKRRAFPETLRRARRRIQRIETGIDTDCLLRRRIPGVVMAQRLDGAGSNQLDSWIAIAADGNVTAYTGKCELGHGLYTAQTQLVAEELGVPFNRVKLVQCDTALTPDQGTTSGAQSHPDEFQPGQPRAGRRDRARSAAAASRRLDSACRSISSRRVDGVISVKGDAAKKVSYGELVGGRRSAWR